jgi:polysaccharide biosynthesis protein PslH
MGHKRLSILFVTPYVPAARVRPMRFIEHLAENGHKITAAFLVHRRWEADFVNGIKPYCEEVHPVFPDQLSPYVRGVLSLPTRVPLSVSYSMSRELNSVIRSLLRKSKYDLIHTEFIRAAQYTAHVDSEPKIFDAVDCLTLAYGRALKNRHTHILHRALALEEWLKMRYYEPWVLRFFNHAIVTSPMDQACLEGNGINVDVVPNGVDLEYFHWHDSEKKDNSLVFLGKMDYYVNIDSINHFYKYIYPLIQSEQPKISLTIVGYNPTRSILALSKDPSIEVTGGVPDVRPYLARAVVAIAPMISGSGIQNKILQAMAVGTPVVTTSLACQALQVTNGEHLLVADQPEEFAEAVTGLLKDKALQKKLSTNARRYVEEFHNWDTIGAQLEGIYLGLV